MSAQRGLGAGRRIVTAVVGLSAAVGAAGCIAVGGSEKHAYPTLGRQLIDLKAARDGGTIDDQEYATAKHHLLHGR